MSRPYMPVLRPVVRIRDIDGAPRRITAADLLLEVEGMERVAVWALAQGNGLMDEVLADHSAPDLKVRLAARYYSIAAANGGLINGRLNAFKFGKEVARGDWV